MKDNNKIVMLSRSLLTPLKEEWKAVLDGTSELYMKEDK